jgi:aryl-alcohol dehydrogenase-like predicted oxidoreductase
MGLETRKLGATGEEVTALGLGGEGVLRTFGHEKEAYALINRALDMGVRYFESARAYSGSEEYYGRALGPRRKEIFLTSKSHARDKKGAMDHLHQTLSNMKTDYLDLWQVHDMRTMEDVNAISSSGGALEAFAEAKDKGLARFVGVTGHHDPQILLKCFDIFPFDTVLIPVNPAEPSYKSFISSVMPEALNRNMGIIGMKAYFRGFAKKLPDYTSMAPYLRFALSHPVSAVVVGCDNISQLEENFRYAENFQKMSDEEMDELISKTSVNARALMYYKP